MLARVSPPRHNGGIHISSRQRIGPLVSLGTSYSVASAGVAGVQPGRKTLMTATTRPASPIRSAETYHRWPEIDPM